MKSKDKMSRREFLKVSTFSIGGLISAVMGIPAIAYVIGPSLRKTEDRNWIPLGAAEKIEIGVPTLFKTKVKRQAGWIVDEQELSIYVLTENGRDFTAMSNVCTHLGCRVRWVGDEETFFCPCHNAQFNKDGTVADGPPPRPLDRYEVKEEGGQIYVFGG